MALPWGDLLEHQQVTAHCLLLTQMHSCGPSDSYMKAQELDKKGSYASEIQIGLGQVQMASNNMGIGRYNSGELAGAGTHSLT